MRGPFFVAVFCLLASDGLASQDDPEIRTPAGSPQSSATAAPQISEIRAIIEREARIANLPFAIADAVVQVESRYDWTVVGSVGEIGLMQIRPETAAMLGFQGTATELAIPEINIHYGVSYLAQAWRLAGGELCRALMKYRAGWGEEVMTPRSVDYCARARSYLATRGAALDSIAYLEGPAPTFGGSRALHKTKSLAPTSVYSRFRRGTEAASRAFWKIKENRVRLITARIEAKWRRISKRG